MPTPTNAIHWFEIPATDLERAARFYEAMLGIKLERMGTAPTPMAIFSGGAQGVSGCLVADPGNRPSDAGARVYLAAPDLDACVSRVAAAGGAVVQPKTSIAPHGWFALVRDPEGNTVGLHAE